MPTQQTNLVMAQDVAGGDVHLAVVVEVGHYHPYRRLADTVGMWRRKAHIENQRRETSERGKRNHNLSNE